MKRLVSGSGGPTESALLFAVGVVFVGSVLPLPANGDAAVVGPFGVGADKWIHAVSYAVIGALAADRRSRRSGHPLALLGTVLVVAAFGAGVEVAQSFVPGRSASGADAVANTLGAAVGVGVVVCWWAVVRRRGTVSSR